MPRICKNWNSATWFQAGNPCANREDGTFVKNCNALFECQDKMPKWVTDRPGHYQHLITSMESNQSARRRKSLTRTVVFVGLGIVVALAAVLIVQSMN